MTTTTLIQADARRIPLADKSVQMVCTSPPYYALRDYGTAKWEGGDGACGHVARDLIAAGMDGSTANSCRPGRTPPENIQYRDVCGKCGARRVDAQIGLEPSIEAYLATLVEVFREVKRVLRDDGTCWVNLGDAYAHNGACGGGSPDGPRKARETDRAKQQAMNYRAPDGIAPKNLLGMPWRIAFALQADGWILRSDIVWCLSGGTRLYARTQKGDMPATIHDLVRLDPTTVQLWNGRKWTQVLGWSESPERGEPLEIVLRSGERIGCTPGHVWPTHRGNVRADELKVGDILKTCRLPETSEIAPPSYLTSGVMFFLGLYLAEGSMADDTIQISAHADELHWLKPISDLATHYGGSCTHTLDGNNLSIRVYSRVLRAILETYIGGSTAKDKHLKVEAWSLPDYSLKEIANGYLAGDGHDDVGNERVRLGFCRNYNLEGTLRTLAARLGAVLTLNPCTATNQNGNYEAFRGEWRWERTGHWNERDRAEIMDIRGSKGRTFWDIGVEDDPHLFALASGVLTHNSKPNPMPESVTDRPTKSHEYIFLLAKRPAYYYDAEACRENTNSAPDVRLRASTFKQAGKVGNHHQGAEVLSIVGRNMRSVWTITPKPFAGAHFATFPAELVRRCVAAGTSEKGQCPHCGTAWERVVDKQLVSDRGNVGQHKGGGRADSFDAGSSYNWSGGVYGHYDVKTFGWRPGCTCPPHEPVPQVVFDPFGGAGTVPMVASNLGRRGIMTELNPKYIAMARRRISRPHAQHERAERQEDHPLFAGLA